MNLVTLRQHPYSLGRSLPMVLGTMLVLTVLSCIGWSLDPLFAEENHPIELLQGILLLLACLVHGERALRLEKSSVSFLIHAGLAILMYSFFLRETDIREMDADGAHLWHWVEHAARAIGVVLWLAYFLHAALRLKRVFAQRLAILKLPVIWMALLGGVFLVAGWPFDKEVFHAFMPQEISRLIEEVLELNAYLLLFAGSLADSNLPGAALDALAAGAGSRS